MISHLKKVNKKLKIICVFPDLHRGEIMVYMGDPPINSVEIV